MSIKLKNIKESLDNQKLGRNDKKAFLEEISNFNQIGESIYRTDGMREAAEKVDKMCKMAERLALQETEEWFDDVTVKRNMKELGNQNKQFQKTIKETAKMQQRLESLYEEIGSTLSRYYEIKDAAAPLQENSPNIQGQPGRFGVGPKEPVYVLVQKRILNQEDADYLQDMGSAENTNWMDVKEMEELSAELESGFEEDDNTELDIIVKKLKRAGISTVFGIK